MVVDDAQSAREWLKSWGQQAFSLHRCERLIKDMTMCAGECRDQVRAEGFLAAAKVLRDAQTKYERNKEADYGPK